ncbi:MAG: aspartate/glutamate racemase family protein [Spirochaetota bacterium]
MKKTAIIGGIGPESTLDYYRGIIDAFKDGYAEHGFPELIIDSLNLRDVIAAMNENKWDEIAELFSARFNFLEKSGADFGVIASNTPHRVFRGIQERTTLPLISIVTETCRHIAREGIGSVCLLGTGFTMRSDFFVGELRDHSIAAVVPDDKEIDYIQEKLMTEIELGIVKDDTKKGFLEIVKRIAAESKVQGVILGCTELPLIIKPSDTDLVCIDTMRIHIDSIVREIQS